MKANEIILRQDRVVYILMVLLAAVGLVWGVWEHQRQHAPGGSASGSTPTVLAPGRR